MAKAMCECRYLSVYKCQRPFIKHACKSACGGPRPDPPPKTETLHTTPIDDTAIRTIQSDYQQYENTVTVFALNYMAEDHDTWLRMALQAPLRFFTSLTHNPEPMTIIWDSGASTSITPNKQDFVDGVKRVPASIKLIGLDKSLQIEGVGKVTWNVLDHNGNLRSLCIPAYYVPGSQTKLLSTQACF